jgi:hypothetical protein
MDINYVIDEKGNHSAVIVPIRQWENFMSRFSKMKNKLEVLTGLEEAVDEVNSIKKGKKQPKSLTDFLDEN